VPRFAANIGWMALEVPMLERFQLVRDLGFTAVECPIVVYDHPAADLAYAYQAAGLDFLMINSPPGSGEKPYGLGGLKGREAEFRDVIGQALDYARALKCEFIHILAGHDAGDWREEGFEVFVENLKWACPELARHNVTALIEPINTISWPGYLVQTTAEAQRIVDAVKAAGSGNIGIQFDFNNCQIMEGSLSMTFEKHLPAISHIQIAGNPGRTPPDEGEINYGHILPLIDHLGFKGWVGCEYWPHDKEQPGATKASLNWAKAYGLG